MDRVKLKTKYIDLEFFHEDTLTDLNFHIFGYIEIPETKIKLKDMNWNQVLRITTEVDFTEEGVVIPDKHEIYTVNVKIPTDPEYMYSDINLALKHFFELGYNLEMHELGK